MRLTVIKIGGNIIDDSNRLSAFLKEFVQLEGVKILVHGGGKIATEIGKKLGIEPAYVNGRRITDRQTLDLVTMVYGGLINKDIVARLQAQGCNAIGLTGVDGGILPAAKRPVKEVDYGFVGDINSHNVKASVLTQFLRMNLVPVIAPLTFEASGYMLNTNADTIAQEVAKALSADWDVNLIYCFERKGVLLDPNDDNTVIANITASGFEELKEKGIITDGMIPKLENALQAVSSGVKKVIIGQAEDLTDLYSENAGTCIL